MNTLNYNHLHYFWLVAREGGLARAAEELLLSQSTVHKQIHQLEDSLGHKLFEKSGRKLVLTESGRIVYHYAEEMFGLGKEMLDTLGDRPAGRPMRVTVGIADAVPKAVAERVLAPTLKSGGSVRMVCREGKHEKLLADLAVHELDVVLTDAPASPDASVRSFSHLLGESGVSIFGSTALAERYGGDFPRSLDGAPMLLPTENTMLRRSLDQWFGQIGVKPEIVGEFEDNALLKVFGMRGEGIFPATSVMADEIAVQAGIRLLGGVPEITERLYAITVERRIKHPVVVAICDTAKASVFGPVKAETPTPGETTSRSR